MRRLAIPGFVVAMLMLIAPIQVRAQQHPVTIEQTEDCALGMIRFEAAVTGAANIVVTPNVIRIWRVHFANMYSQLPLYYQVEYGPQACGKLGWLMGEFSLLPVSEREQYQQVWAASLPTAFQLLVNPVLYAAQQAEQTQQARQAEALAQQNPACALRGNADAELKYLLAHPGGRLCGTPNSDPGAVARTVENGMNQGRINTQQIIDSWRH